MAKVQGPLFSVEASGTYGGAVTFAKWKGRQYVRARVDPSNPQTAAQMESRDYMRLFGEAQRWANATASKRAGETETDKQELTRRAPPGQAWNGWLVGQGIGQGGQTFQAAEAAWAAMAGAQQTAWDTSAAALSPPMQAVPTFEAGGVPGTPYTAGKVFYIYEYALARCGVAPTPGQTPPTYA